MGVEQKELEGVCKSDKLDDSVKCKVEDLKRKFDSGITALQKKEGFNIPKSDIDAFTKELNTRVDSKRDTMISKISTVGDGHGNLSNLEWKVNYLTQKYNSTDHRLKSVEKQFTPIITSSAEYASAEQRYEADRKKGMGNPSEILTFVTGQLEFPTIKGLKDSIPTLDIDGKQLSFSDARKLSSELYSQLSRAEDELSRAKNTLKGVTQNIVNLAQLSTFLGDSTQLDRLMDTDGDGNRSITSFFIKKDCDTQGIRLDNPYQRAQAIEELVGSIESGGGIESYLMSLDQNSKNTPQGSNNLPLTGNYLPNSGFNYSKPDGTQIKEKYKDSWDGVSDRVNSIVRGNESPKPTIDTNSMINQIPSNFQGTARDMVDDLNKAVDRRRQNEEEALDQVFGRKK